MMLRDCWEGTVPSQGDCRKETDFLDKHLLVAYSYILVLYLWCICVLYRALILRLSDIQRVIWGLGVLKRLIFGIGYL